MRKNISIILAMIMILGCFPTFSFAEETETYTKPFLLTLNPDTEMNVCWLTKDKTNSYVEFGETQELGTKVAAIEYEFKGLRTSKTSDAFDEIPENNPELQVYQQIATLKNLKPNTTYYYKAVTNDESTKIYNFKTAPVNGEDFDFALLSDLQLKQESPATVKQLGQNKPDFIIFAGDMANTPWKASEWFKVDNCFLPDEEKGKSFFEILQQEEDGTELLQYTPIFPVPGNHEVDDQRYFTEKEFAEEGESWELSIYMQLFRPLYPEQEYGKGGKHWYSVDYGDLHISNISVFRYQPWDGFEVPGWIMFDDISPDSEQVKWLEDDLKNSDAKYKWVNMHWHMLNRGEDGHIPVSEPVIDGDKVTYPNGDYCYDVLRPLYEKYGVDGVCFGHSHVYERYIINGVNYIEAASIGNNYRAEDDPYHPSGNMPIIENNDIRSFMLLRKNENGITARGIAASGETKGAVFDVFTLTEGKSIPVRTSFESLGATVTWTKSNNSSFVTVTKGNTEIILNVDDNYAIVNGNKVLMDGKTVLKDSRTYVPQAVLEILK